MSTSGGGGGGGGVQYIIQLDNQVNVCLKIRDPYFSLLFWDYTGKSTYKRGQKLTNFTYKWGHTCIYGLHWESPHRSVYYL